MIYWDYSSHAAQHSGALPPESFDVKLPHAVLPREFDVRSKAIEDGLEVIPVHCPHVRATLRHGLVIRAPGEVVVSRRETNSGRSFTSHLAADGLIEVSGMAWPEGESGFVASWVLGSSYCKVLSGIVIYYPVTQGLFQGPLPDYATTKELPRAEMGIEFVNSGRRLVIDGMQYVEAEMNAIFRVTKDGLRLDRGDPILWVFPVTLGKESSLVKLSSHDNL